MSIFTLTPYFTAYLVNYFYNSKTRDDRIKWTSHSESMSKNTFKKRSFYIWTKLNWSKAFLYWTVHYFPLLSFYLLRSFTQL